MTGKNERPTTFGFLLLNGFTHISLSSAIEPLRMTNRVTGREHFRWTTFSEDGEPVTASDGLRVVVDRSSIDANALINTDLLFVCGGLRPEQNCSPTVSYLLRTAERREISLGAVCTGSYALAAAGLLNGYRCSIHWENMIALAEAFPNVVVCRTLFTIDRNRFTCSGGTAPLDLMLHIVRRHIGPRVAEAVAEQFVCERIREADDVQRMPIRYRVGNVSDKFTLAVELMEANLREPISQDELAEYVDVSRRHLQRLFKKFLMCSPTRHYTTLKLIRARELLRHSGMSIGKVAEESGFETASYFSTCYKKKYGHAPAMECRLGARCSSARESVCR